MTTEIKERHGITSKVTIGGVRGYITANPAADGGVYEVFVHGFGKFGSTSQGWVDGFCILMSLGLQSGLDLEKFGPRLVQLKFEPNGETDNPEIPHCHSIPDYICRWLASKYGSDEIRAELDAIYKSMRRQQTGS